ncbi:hypothetical protein LWI29_000192 [Acer saccharum]|uniref:Phosphoribosyltransferase domain-containing protein n=1 Tax=Acer saccharum TaxID=4024 RepID=A0AA39TMQ8_ACESA|nr:hypothetical protein LWI29_000192 [Acer saccharum]
MECGFISDESMKPPAFDGSTMLYPPASMDSWLSVHWRVDLVLMGSKDGFLGGTIVAAINLLNERRVENKQIKVISVVAAPPALQKLNDNFSGLHVYTVNDKGFIILGLGDARDRSFGT